MKLSATATRVLRVVRDSGPLDSPRAAELAGAARCERDLYSALVVLRGWYLVRWDEGGASIRITRAGRQLLASLHYRRF